MPQILKIDAKNSDFSKLRPVLEVLLSGGVVAGPTESSYGLMASADRPDGLKKIFEIKGRNPDNPLLLLLDRPIRLSCYARKPAMPTMEAVEKIWPGKLSVLLHALPGLDKTLVGPGRKVGLRVEALPIIQNLVRALDRAVSGTSANPSGLPPARTAEEVLEYFKDQVDLIIDAGERPNSKPSSLVDLTSQPPRLLREGMLPADELLKTFPGLVL